MSERKTIEDEAAPHSMWTLLSKMLTVRLPTCQSHGPPPALGHPLSVSQHAPGPTGHLPASWSLSPKSSPHHKVQTSIPSVPSSSRKINDLHD